MIQRLLRRLQYAIRHRQAERDLREELEVHAALKRQDFENAGLDAATADVEARRALGSQLLARDHVRDVWVWPWLGGFLLDFRLALRMLAKYPLLTVVASAGMAFGMAAGVGGFEIRAQIVDPRLPLDDGRNIVGLRNWDISRNSPGPLGEADFLAWRDQLPSVEDLGAFALVERNLIVDGAVEPISVAQMTASGFRIARVPPLLGRTLLETDERPNAPPAAVIGHSLWQRRFLGDRGIVGRSVRLGIEPTTIVGVMPEGFEFPVAHQLWIPLRTQAAGNASEAARRVFGRLARGASVRNAQAELTTVGLRMAAAAPDTHRFLQPEVVPYAHLIRDPRNSQLPLALANIFLIMLVVLISANVALLMFARAATRESEMAVRHALGATRSRIVAQLFVEAVVLSGLSIIVGLTAARFALGSFWRLREADSGQALAFWLNDSLAPATVAYGVGLTMFGAVIIGVLPALAITGRGLHARLKSFTAGGGGYRFGGVWTAVIVAQVAATVLFPATAFFFHRAVVLGQAQDVGFPVEEYLSARLAMGPADTPGTLGETAAGTGGRMASTLEELRRRLTAEPGVTAVTFAERVPGTLHPGARYEVEGDEAPPTGGYQVGIASVDSGFFAALDAPVLSGRGFTPADLASDREVAIVNASFVEGVLRGRNPVGRRIRLGARGSERAPGPWIEIVGVVPDLGVNGNEGIGLYRPLASGYTTVHLVLHVPGAPESLAGRVRALASQVEPMLRVYDVLPLDQVGADQWLESQVGSRLLVVLSGIALLLSLTAIYSIMAFTVVQRTREIGVRVALGADRRRIIAAVVRRPLGQIGLGIGVGGTLVVLTYVGLFESTLTPVEAGMIAAYAVLMLGVCLMACFVPARRALRLEPSQVLRADG
jgi:putative ABC transport system permease protein